MPGEKSFIRIELWLPSNWNGIFLGLGNSGMAGNIYYRELVKYVKQGYAAANTDLGTSKGREYGINNPDVWKDFGWRATHLMTVLGKTVLREYYGKKEDYSYFVGRSTGGQQAFSLMQRFPDDYDGIIAGVPANNRVYLHTYFLWNYVHLHPKNGTALFSDQQITAITNCAVDFFHSRNYGKENDNFVAFPYTDKNTVEDFLAFLKNKHSEFSDSQLSALNAVYKGPVNPKNNKQIYNGMPIGSEIYNCGISCGSEQESPYFYPFIWAFGENYDGYDFNFAEDLDIIGNKLSHDLNANNDDITEYCKIGGKIIAYSGSADPCVPFPDAVKYYNRVCEKMGGYNKVKSFFKYFIIPGRDHSGAGNGVNDLEWEEKNMISALRDWCEKGKEPEFITARRTEVKDGEKVIIFERKIYPYKADKKETEQFPRSCDIDYLKH